MNVSTPIPDGAHHTLSLPPCPEEGASFPLQSVLPYGKLTRIPPYACQDIFLFLFLSFLFLGPYPWARGQIRAAVAYATATATIQAASLTYTADCSNTRSLTP